MIDRQQWSTHPRALVQFILIASALALGGCAAQTDDGIVAGPILTGTSDAETAEAAEVAEAAEAAGLAEPAEAAEATEAAEAVEAAEPA